MLCADVSEHRLFYLHRSCGQEESSTQPMKMEQSLPKRRHIKFRRRGIIQKKEYIIYNKANV